VTNGNKSYWEADDYCRSFGGQLASISGENMQLWIESLLQKNRRYWIGANDFEEEGVFQWSDSAAFEFANWGSKEPSAK